MAYLMQVRSSVNRIPSMKGTRIMGSFLLTIVAAATFASPVQASDVTAFAGPRYTANLFGQPYYYPSGEYYYPLVLPRSYNRTPYYPPYYSPYYGPYYQLQWYRQGPWGHRRWR
jgi:hypothetical protein